VLRVRYEITVNESNIRAQVAPVAPESFLWLSVRDMNDLSYAWDDVRSSSDKLAHLADLVAFRQSKDVFDSCRSWNLLIQPDQQRLERQERFVAHRRTETLSCSAKQRSRRDSSEYMVAQKDCTFPFACC